LGSFPVDLWSVFSAHRWKDSTNREGGEAIDNFLVDQQVITRAVTVKAGIPRWATPGSRLPAVASADASDDYPDPQPDTQDHLHGRSVHGRDATSSRSTTSALWTDYNNGPPDIQQGARDRFYWFFSLDYAGRRQY